MDTTQQLEKKYKSKKQNCVKSGTEITLTKEEFLHMFNTHNGVCDYTGLPTTMDDPASPSYLTLERISASQGYLIGNVCLIRSDANALKGLVIDHAEDDTRKCSFKDRSLLLKIVETLYNPVKMDDIRKKYGHPIQNITQQTVEKNMTKVSDLDTTETATVNPEVAVAGKFLHFNEFVTDKLYLEFAITFSQFKTLLGRRVCQLTKRELSLKTSSLFVIDKTLPVTRDNVLVVETKVRNHLDTFLNKSELSTTELKTLCKVLMK